MKFTRSKTQAIILYFEAQQALLRYGLAALTVAAAAIATQYIPVIGVRAAFLLFFFAIIQTSFWLGRNPGLFAMILSLIVANALVLVPAWISKPYDFFILNAGFCILSTVIITTTSLHRRLTVALWESRQDLGHAQAVGQIGSWRLNVQRNELRWSDENHRIFGIPKGTTLTYETFLSTVHPDDREYVDRMWQAALCGDAYDIEHRLVVAGKVKWVRERAILEFGKKGNLLGGFGTTQDITRHKRNELAVLESRQRYAGIVESAMDAIITFDTDQRILLFNAAAQKMFGCTADKAIGVFIEGFIPELFGTAQKLHIGLLGGAGKTGCKAGELVAITGLRANGEEFPIEASIAQCEIDGKKSFTAILRDVTDRKREERALQDRLTLQDQLVKVAATVPGVICSFRLRPDGSSCMPYASPVFESVYGFKADAVAEDFSPVFARIHPGDAGHIHETIAESARTMQPWRDYFRYDHPAKGEIWIEGHSIPLRETDGSTLWHGYIQDVSWSKKAELERQKFVSLAENSQEFIGMCDMNFMPFYVNPAGIKLVGLDSLEQALMTPVQDFFFPEDQRFIMEEFFPRVMRERRGEVEVRFRHFHKGATLWMLYNVFYITNDNGEPVGLATVSRDITSRKLAESALRVSEEQLCQAKNAAALGIYDHDLVSGTIQWDARVREIWGVQPDETITLAIFLERLHPDDRASMRNAVRRAFDPLGSGEYSAEYRVIRPIDNQLFWLAVFGTTTFANGRPIRLVGFVQDITERKRAEAALEESERQNRFLANILENSNQPFGTGFPDGRLEYVNPAFERLTGYSRDELLAMDWVTELTPSEWKEAEQAKLEELQRTLHAVRYEKEYFRKDGLRVPVELLVELDSTNASHPIRYYAFLTNLTERKQAEAALRESEERIRLSSEKHLHELQTYQIELEMQNEQLRHATFDLEISRTHYIELYDFAPVGYLMLTTEGMIAEINLTGSKLLGVERNKLIHWRFAKFIADEYKDHWYKFCLKAKQQDSKQSIELPLRRQDGTGLFVHFDCQYKKPADALPLLHVALTDITERSLAEAALRESEVRLALIIEEVKAGYWDWNLTTDAVYLSPEWKRQIGFNENELLDRWEEWECRLHPGDRALVSAVTENYIAGRLPVFEMEFRLRHKDGSYRWIHCRGALLRDQNNRPNRMLGINLDITDYKKTKEMNERREQMEQTFRFYVASQTVAAIAHELNQPLAAISSYADVALHMLQTGNRNPQKLSHVLENCALQAQRAGDVIRQLMTVLHKGEAIREPIDINISVREALAFVKTDEHLGAFNIELDLAAGLSQVSANGLQIQKVLVNLLHNGLESMQESGINEGTMTVTTRNSAVAPAMAQVTVCDSGKGVADTATLKTMFLPFHTTKTTGLGMGLAISRALIEAYGGKMWAEQNAGRGLSVHFTLPFAT